jgi:tRNA G18 (ribose-2'-O)-methylase SpoU
VDSQGLPVDDLDDPRLDDYRHIADPGALVARGLFVAEGRLVVDRLVRDRRFVARSLLLTDAAATAMASTLAAVDAATPVFTVPQAVMNGIVGFNIHRGCLGLAERPPAAALTALPLADCPSIVIAEGVNNPDNVGGLFRNAAALGAAAVVLGPDCGDPLYRKAIRTSMAATLRLPWAAGLPWPDALDAIRSAGLTVVACTPAPDASSLYDVDLPSRVAVLVGAEGPGLSRAALDHADLRVRIPMHADMDSLNVATAAAIVLSALAAAHAQHPR